MTQTLFNVTFYGIAPDGLRVGDTLNVHGRATVGSIQGDLVDITALGADPTFTLGSVTVDLHSNRFEVEAA